MSVTISVIVLTYNSRNTIIKTLESIKKQTYDNIEIVVSDDCSTDDTLDVIKKWRNEKYSRKKMKIVTNEVNTGITANVNRGIKAASGKMVKLIAGDDVLCDKAIEVFYSFYKNNSHNIVFQSKVQTIDENDLSTNQIDDVLEESYHLLSQANQEEQYHNLLLTNYILSPAIGLISKRNLDRIGLFDERFPMMEDYPFFLNLSQKGIKYSLIDEELVKYRISNNSISNTKKTRTFVRFTWSKVKFDILVRIRLLLKEGYVTKAFRLVLGSIKRILEILMYYLAKIVKN